MNKRKALKLIRSVKLPVVIAGQLLQISFEKQQTKESISKDNLEWLRVMFLNKRC